MNDPLTHKIELPPVLVKPPVVPRGHFSSTCEDVMYEPEREPEEEELPEDMD